MLEITATIVAVCLIWLVALFAWKVWRDPRTHVARRVREYEKAARQ